MAIKGFDRQNNYIHSNKGKMDIGLQIQNLREQPKISQEELALKIFVSRPKQFLTGKQVVRC